MFALLLWRFKMPNEGATVLVNGFVQCYILCSHPSGKGSNWREWKKMERRKSIFRDKGVNSKNANGILWLHARMTFRFFEHPCLHTDHLTHLWHSDGRKLFGNLTSIQHKAYMHPSIPGFGHDRPLLQEMMLGYTLGFLRGALLKSVFCDWLVNRSLGHAHFGSGNSAVNTLKGPKKYIDKERVEMPTRYGVSFQFVSFTFIYPIIF